MVVLSPPSYAKDGRAPVPLVSAMPSTTPMTPRAAWLRSPEGAGAFPTVLFVVWCMGELSMTSHERSRKAHSLLLQAMQDPGTQRNLALALGVSESTVSRTKTEKLEDAVTLIYQLGFKVVASDRVCVDRAKFEAVLMLARAAMSDEDTVRKLVWEE